MAASSRPTTANYEIHEKIVIDTSDNEDHSFCGIMFPIKAKMNLPLSKLIINSVAVRGYLGPMSVWVTKEYVNVGVGQEDSNNSGDCSDFHHDPKYWTKIYDCNHEPSICSYTTLDFSHHPIILLPGESRAIYVHSRALHDRAIVYDNGQYSWSHPHLPTHTRYEDDVLAIYTGKAHLSPEPFSRENPFFGSYAWRSYREFVGQVQYGVVYKLWQPELHTRFCSDFQSATHTLLCCQRRWESPISRLPDECLFYVLNMCRHDWFDNENNNNKPGRLNRLKALSSPSKNTTGYYEYAIRNIRTVTTAVVLFAVITRIYLQDGEKV